MPGFWLTGARAAGPRNDYRVLSPAAPIKLSSWKRERAVFTHPILTGQCEMAASFYAGLTRLTAANF